MFQVICQTIGVYITSTLVFDFFHLLLHRFSACQNHYLKKIGNLHMEHHRFFNHDLRYDDRHFYKDFLYHQVPEFVVSVLVLLVFFIFSEFLTLKKEAIIFVFFYLVVLFIARFLLNGRDLNHVEGKKISSLKSSWFVGPNYHALHHMYPDSYHGSITTVIDRVFGTAFQTAGKRFALTGTSGALGKALKRVIESKGGLVSEIQRTESGRYRIDHHTQEILRKSDVLILSHGTKEEKSAREANVDSFIRLMEAFKAIKEVDGQIPEIWGVGSEIEFHPAFGDHAYGLTKRAFANYASDCFFSPSLTYRHIVPSAFRSQMGFGLFSAEQVARITLFLIERGLFYVPVTYTGIALLNYFKFVSRSKGFLRKWSAFL